MQQGVTLTQSKVLQGGIGQEWGKTKPLAPAHFTLEPKAWAEESYCRGHIMKVQKRAKDMAEDNLMLGTPLSP